MKNQADKTNIAHTVYYVSKSSTYDTPLSPAAYTTKRGAYKDALIRFIGQREWAHLATFTCKSDRDVFFFQAVLSTLQKRLLQQSIYLDYAVSVEQTKNGRNHAHAFLRYIFKPAPSLSVKDSTALNLLPRGTIPTYWEDRCSSGIVRYVYNEANIDPRGLSQNQATMRLRRCVVDVRSFINIWYRTNHGAIVDVQEVRSNEAVSQYALKYAMKAYDDKSSAINSGFDWFIN